MGVLDNGDFFTAWEDSATYGSGWFAVTDPHGILIDKKIFTQSPNHDVDWLGACALTGRRIMIAYCNDTTDRSLFVIYGEYYLELKKISSNEVRLYNNTGETLSLSLSLDQ